MTEDITVWHDCTPIWPWIKRRDFLTGAVIRNCTVMGRFFNGAWQYRAANARELAEAYDKWLDNAW